MNGFYEKMLNNGVPFNGKIIPSTACLSQDFLNSSQTEKNWLNSSINEKNYLNSSLSLPPEQRYQSLNEMVAKIVEDENNKNFLASSGNSNSLQFSFNALRSYQNPGNYQPFIQISPTNSFFISQESKSRENCLNESFTNKFIYNQFNSHYQTPDFHNKNTKQALNYNNEISNFNNNNQFSNEQKVIQSTIPNQNNQLKAISKSQNTHRKKNDFEIDKTFTTFDNNKPEIYNSQNIINQNRSKDLETNQSLNIQQPAFLQTQLQMNQNFNFNYNNALAFPSAFSHQLATLTVDQQSYLLQQQRLLVMAMAATEQKDFNQFHNTQLYYPLPKQQNFSLNNIYSNQFNQYENNNKTLNPQPVLASFLSSSTGTTSSTPNSPKINKNIQNNPNNMNYFSYLNNNSNNTNTNSSFYSNNFKYQEKQFNSPFCHTDTKVFNFGNNNLNNIPDNNSNEILMNRKTKFDNRNIIDANNSPITLNNEKIRFLANQSYRQHRRTGPANELHVRLEECSYQFKSLENERKKIESDLSHLNIIRRLNNTNSSIISLPPNPSRVDRLIADSSKEYAKLINLITKMDNLKGNVYYINIQNSFQKWFEGIQFLHAKRKDELINCTNRRRLMGSQQVVHMASDDKDVLILANALHKLAILTSKARTTLWCCFQISNINLKEIYDTVIGSEEFINIQSRKKN